MLSIDRILWPTDFSTESARAFPYAAALASWHEAEIHVLNVAQDGSSDSPGMAEEFPMSLGTLANLLDVGGQPSQPINLESLSLVQERMGDTSPAEGIVEYATDHDADLVVVGTRGRRGLKRLLIGSVSEEVLREAPCPVLTVRGTKNVAPAWAVRNILVPIDFSEASEGALRHAKELALTYGAQLTLLHAVEEVVYPSAYGLEPIDLPGPEVVERVEKSLATLVQNQIGYEHVVIDATVGYAPSVILDRAERDDVDLIVIATHGRTGLERVLLGSVTERVVRQASSPVFTVKSFGKSLVPSDTEETQDG